MQKKMIIVVPDLVAKCEQSSNVCGEFSSHNQSFLLSFGVSANVFVVLRLQINVITKTYFY